MITPQKQKVMQRYFMMFGFGIVFMILMVIQNLFLSNFIFIIVEFLELIGVYFIIKNYAKRELDGL